MNRREGRRPLRRLLAAFLSVSILFSLTPMVCAMETTVVSSIAYYKSRPGDLGVEVSWNESENRYDVALPDTRGNILRFFVDGSDSAQNYALYGSTGNIILTKKNFSSTTGSSLPAIMPSKLPAGSTVDLTLTVGSDWDSTNKVFSTVTESWTLHHYVKLMLTGLSALDAEGQNLDVAPAFDPLTSSYAVALEEGQETVTINAEPKTALGSDDSAGTVLKYTDDMGREVFSQDGAGTFSLESLPVNESGRKYLNITVAYTDPNAEVASSTYTVVFVDPASVLPNVTTEGATELSLEKDEAYQLSVKATVTSGDLDYQWYQQSAMFDPYHSGTLISGANGPTYQPSTTYSSEDYYWCDVTNTVDGLSFTTHSPAFRVTVEPTYASEPEFYLEPTSVATYEGQRAYFNAAARAYDNGSEVTFRWHRVEDDGSKTFVGEGTHFATYYQIPGGGQALLWYFYPDTTTAGSYTYVAEAVSTLSANGETASSWSSPVTLTVNEIEGLSSLPGSGTEDDPYLVSSVDDLLTIKEVVEGGESGLTLENKYFRLESDLTIPEDWDPIGDCWPGYTLGESTDELENAFNGKYVNPFSGNFDGNGHTVTIAPGGKAIFGLVRRATIENLKIYGENIDGSAVINGYFTDYGTTGIYNNADTCWTVKIDNVTLLSGSHTSASGFMRGSGSGVNRVWITNSVVEEGVVIGQADTGTANASFISQLNGSLENCVSYATVYGTGGLAATKGQTIGPCSIQNSAFLGTLISKSYAGGILGSGYGFRGFDEETGHAIPDESAPNTPVPTIRNCYVAADISGQYMVGGILGGDPSIEECWSNGVGSIANNHFYGTIKLTGRGDAGGIIGYVRGYDRWQNYHNNYYNEDCGVTSGIGAINNIIYQDGTPQGDKYGLAEELIIDKICTPVAKSAYTDGTLVEKLNSTDTSLKNWVQGEFYPVLSDKTIVSALELSGSYKTTYYLGDAFDPTGMTFTAKWSDGTEETLSADQVTITGYDPNTRGVQTLTATYQAAKVEFKITVLKPAIPEAPNTITVYFKLMGDDNHNWADDYIPEEEETHTLQYGGLKTWISNAAYTIDQNATVADLLNLVAEKHGVVFGNPTGNYVESITYKGITLGEFDNGKLSGWMYTLNESHPIYGISEQFLEDGDRIVWHYTDDYTREKGSENWGNGGTAGGVTSRTEGSSPVLEPEVSADKNGHATVVVPRKDLSKAIESASENGTQSIVIAPQVSGNATSLTVTIPKSSVTDILDETKAGLSIECDLGEIELPQDALAAIVKAAGSSDITVTIAAGDSEDAAKLLGSHEDVTEERMKDASATVITITSDQKYITAFDGRQIALTLPVGGEAIEEGKSYVVYQISDDGTVERLAGECIKQGKKFFVKVTTTHLNTFVVLPVKTVELPFTDVQETDWFYNAVSCAYVNGLFNGTSNTTFSPNDTMTRAMLAAVLYRLAGSPAGDGKAPAFTDVAPDTWYTNAVAWANGNGIVTGYGNGLFGGTDSITREQLVVMLYRYAKFMKHDTAAAGDLSAFTDAGNASDWAVEALRWAYAEGLITGRTATTIVPQGTATRAEVAMILMRFGEELAK